MFQRYSFFQIVSLFIDVIKTRFMFSEARLIRSPSDIRGKKYISVASGFTTGKGCRLEAYPKNKKDVVLFFGKNIQMNDYVHITAMDEVRIGNNVLIASKVYISDNSHGHYAGDENDSSPLSIPKDRPYTTKKVIIGDNVWIGEMVSIMPGVTIGSGTIVGASSVVTKNLPPNTIAVGSPAKPIKKFNFDTQRWESYKL
ncbi:acetyltransferase [Pedobacter boryungensis]|uniref:Acetyltransferase n=2 Tax=Pedobacter boryungensis TaxID=869962 RepID=A0ABX2DGY3_9SPHI|nr:acetyltransferase [Pedobacter boryungensis]